MSSFDPQQYWERRLATSSGLEGVGYLGLGQPFNAWMYRSRRRQFKRLVQAHMVQIKEARVLDVGSGTGEYVRCWQELGAGGVVASDLTSTAVERLKAGHPSLEVRKVDVSSASAELPGRLNAVSCMDVLFHIVDDEACERAIRNMSSALVPGGFLYISENFVHVDKSDQEHFKLRSLAEYERMITAAGLTIVDRRPMFHLMNAPVDSNSRWLHLWWSFVIGVCARSHKLGGLLALVVYPLEQLLIKMRKEGVSTELMVCQKSADALA
jgi:SAM-dependent methyltransferase